MAHELLQIIDEVVAADDGPPGFAGTICVGVGEPGTMSWWRGRFGATIEHTLIDELDANADAIFALAPETAAEIVESGLADAAPSYVVGDIDLLARFIRRYFQNRSLVDVRVRGTT